MRTLRERTSLVFAANTARRAAQDWDEHSRILAAVIDGDEELASMLATRHVRRAADAAFGTGEENRTEENRGQTPIPSTTRR
jgi:DNA-binding GntR family transcriptional regulator